MATYSTFHAAKHYRFTAESMFKDLEKEIARGALAQRKKAAKHIEDKIKAKARARKITGNLEDGAYTYSRGDASYVGFKPPAYHAWLIEFGNYGATPKPILYPTFAEEAGEVERIMAEPWVK